LFPEVVPEVVLSCSLSGDVNQGERREEPLEDLNVCGFETHRQVLTRGVLVDQPRLPKRVWEQQPNRPAEQHPEERHMPQKDSRKSMGDRLVTR
jgi:hypothetical protein